MIEYDQGREALLDQEAFKSIFDEKFKEYANNLAAHASEVDPRFQVLVEHTMDTMTSAGKRLRPYLTYIGFKGFGGVDESRIEGTMLAMEIYHSALLVHDDVMDGDLIRHGVPNVGGRYMAETQDEETARSMAILSGDLLAGLTFGSLVNDEALEDGEKVLMIKELVRLNSLECAGQQLDALLNITPLEEVTLDHIHKLYTYKTALYTYDLPLRYGAILAGASQESLEGITGYATNMGIAFQITDDVMGVFADEAKTGKPKGTDIREGKKTLLVVNAYETGSDSTIELLNNSLGNPNVSPGDIDRLCMGLVQDGVLARTEEIAREHIESAKAYAVASGMNKDALAVLARTADKLIGRTV